jgi:hypothetical protein
MRSGESGKDQHRLRVRLEHPLGCDRQHRLPSRFRFPRVSSEMSDPDRRRAPRIALRQTVSLVIGNGGHQVAAITENLSSAGVLLYTDQLIREGSEIGLILVVPPAEPQAAAKWLWCFGKVLRVERELNEGKFGMAIDSVMQLGGLPNPEIKTQSISLADRRSVFLARPSFWA